MYIPSSSRWSTRRIAASLLCLGLGIAATGCSAPMANPVAGPAGTNIPFATITDTPAAEASATPTALPSGDGAATAPVAAVAQAPVPVAQSGTTTTTTSGRTSTGNSGGTSGRTTTTTTTMPVTTTTTTSKPVTTTTTTSKPVTTTTTTSSSGSATAGFVAPTYATAKVTSCTQVGPSRFNLTVQYSLGPGTYKKWNASPTTITNEIAGSDGGGGWSTALAVEVTFYGMDGSSTVIARKSYNPQADWTC